MFISDLTDFRPLVPDGHLGQWSNLGSHALKMQPGSSNPVVIQAQGAWQLLLTRSSGAQAPWQLHPSRSSGSQAAWQLHPLGSSGAQAVGSSAIFNACLSGLLCGSSLAERNKIGIPVPGIPSKARRGGNKCSVTRKTQSPAVRPGCQRAWLSGHTSR